MQAHHDVLRQSEASHSRVARLMPNCTQPEELPLRYGHALGCYLASGGEPSLHEAYELGHEALHGDIDLLQLVNIHQTAERELVAVTPIREIDDFEEKKSRFLLEALAPFEMMQVGHRDSNKALRRLNLILEEEVGRIAQSLHDEAEQLLATTYLELAAIERSEPSENIDNRVQRIRSHLDQVRSQLRHISHELRSPILDQLGLMPALKFLAEGVQKRAGLSIEVEHETGLEERLPRPVETVLYRAVQEALNNISRHAKASHAWIAVRHNARTAICTVSDDGIGFAPDSTAGDTTSGGLGLLGIRERARSVHGSLRIESIPGRGTALHVEIPLEEAEP